MTTCGALIDEALDLLHGSTRTRINTLRSSVGASDTTFSLSFDLTGFNNGTMLSLDLEVVQVVAVDPTANSVTVIRGQRGSTAMVHSAGDIVTVNPHFSRWSVFRSLNHDLASLSANDIYKVASLDVTYNPAIQGYDLAADVDLILEVRYQNQGPMNEWPLIPQSKFRLLPSASTGSFPSGKGLVLYGGGMPGRVVHVTYRAIFDNFIDESTTTTDVGLPDTALDLPPLGAALELLYGREVQRNFFEAQPDTRRAGEVPAGANMGATRDWERMRTRRIKEESDRLRGTFPIVKR